MDRADEIARRFLSLGMEAPSNLESQRLGAYLDLLLRWNAKMNLTSVREPGEIIDRHFAECVFAARSLPEEIATLLDFGSGAGFPGIPIAVCHPGIHVVLGECQAKKAVFLREALRSLEIPGEVYSGRIESMPTGRLFDAVCMRAVDKMAEAIGVARPRARKYLILLAGQDAGKLKELAPEFQWKVPAVLPGRNGLLLCGERV